MLATIKRRFLPFVMTSPLMDPSLLKDAATRAARRPECPSSKLLEFYDFQMTRQHLATHLVIFVTTIRLCITDFKD